MDKFIVRLWAYEPQAYHSDGSMANEGLLGS